MSHILEVDNLCKKFGALTAVDDVSFAVEEGEIFGLLGPNGAGKTTTISMLTGVLIPDAGTARIQGHDIRREAMEVKKLIGLVPQDLALYPTLSARANLNFFGSIYGLRGNELKSRVDDVLEIVSLADRQKEPIEKFSGGMKRRVNIAAGLVHQPKLLFLDEPTVGVDPQSRNHIFESVLTLNRQHGMSIIYTSHYMEEVELLCNRVAIIDQGRVIALDTIRNLVAMLGGGVIHIGLHAVNPEMTAEMALLPAIKTATLVSGTGDGSAESAQGAVDGSQPKSMTVKIEALNSQQALVSLLGFLNERDISITSLDILEPNLESVFLHLTGKKLRE